MTITPQPPQPGTYTPPQGSCTLPQGAPPPPKSGGCLKAFLIGCGIIIALGFAAVIAIVVLVVNVIKRSDVYREAYSRSISDQRVIERLGTPIDKGWWVIGSIHIDDNGGTADFDFPISGPKGKARVHASATRDAEKWTYSSIIVRPDVGGEIDVLRP